MRADITGIVPWQVQVVSVFILIFIVFVVLHYLDNRFIYFDRDSDRGFWDDGFPPDPSGGVEEDEERNIFASVIVP